MAFTCVYIFIVLSAFLVLFCFVLFFLAGCLLMRVLSAVGPARPVALSAAGGSLSARQAVGHLPQVLCELQSMAVCATGGSAQAWVPSSAILSSTGHGSGGYLHLAGVPWTGGGRQPPMVGKT